MQATHVVALAVDMPFMARTNPRSPGLAGEGCGVVPVIGERAEPLAAIYPAEAAADFRAALEGPDFSLQLVVRKLAAAGRMTLCRAGN